MTQLSSLVWDAARRAAQNIAHDLAWETRTMLARKTLLAACLALPVAGFAGAAHARPASAERIIKVPAGAVVIVLPDAVPVVAPQVAAMPAMPAMQGVGPMLRMVAEQDAMMQHMVRQMQALDRVAMALPTPAQVFQAALGGLPTMRPVPGTSVVTTMVSNGHGVCRETITYRRMPNSARPLVHVVRSGDSCGALHVTGPVGVNQMVPWVAPSHPQPAGVTRQPRLWSVGYPAHAIGATAPRA